MKASFASLLVIFALSCTQETEGSKSSSTDEESKIETKKQQEPKRIPPKNVVYEEGPLPSSDAVIGHAGEVSVNVGDFEFASKLALVVAGKKDPTLPADRMALPHVHFTMTQSLLSRRMAKKKALERGLKVSREEAIAWIAKQKQLAYLTEKDAKADEILKPYAITYDQLIDFASYEVFVEKFVESELKAVEKDEIWKAYAAEKNRVKALVASAHNIPKGSEIDAFVEKNEKRIVTYFEKNKKKFRNPKRVKLDILQLKPKDKDRKEEILKKASEALRKGERLEDIAKKYDLIKKENSKLIYQENAKAFKSKLGSVGWEKKGPRGSYAWMVRGFTPSSEGELNRSTRREIAAKLLRKETISPALVERMELAKVRVLKNMTVKNAKKKGTKLTVLGLRWRVSEFTNRGVIKEFGLVENLVKDAFEHEVGFIGGPLKSREYAYIYKILKKEHANRALFDKKYDEFRVAYLNAKRSQVMPIFMSQFTNTNIDTKALRIKWGVLQKKS